ncbi:transcriptional regulator [Solemya pervernicosa gill symbiont]|uniref:Transcriptional regulator n=2 Tax=Gammaproteobacteria incertae sedis TaxID=118884 RepID=A0A1T2L823_9GAMM|nr:sigma-54 dependent transcriptional regulator [Candidatus Reidiella endopervernicosa]OOZ41258.1 transcriptional regulator [Solemya pervernicosa gill symbiont]QKQ25257.1 sigma-54-dependent Fis family transcriptional regulator [Candidatus Reidiella endopervernicosa]
MSAPHILIVDDEPDIRNLLKEILEDENYDVATAENGEAARQALRGRRPDLIMLDIWMPDIDGITLLKEWNEAGGLPSPVIVMSGHGTVETAVEATRLGAYDFVEKPISLAKLLVMVQRALESGRLQRENVGLKKQAPADEPSGKSERMQQLRDQVVRIAQHDTRVLILGEPGTGKEVFARYLHASSARADAPFVEVGVGAIAGENSAVELFGSEEGDRVHYGLFEQANGGTLFLNEIADMDQQTQARLQSVLESKNFMRVGGSESVEVDVRVVAATHRDLEQLVREGAFREDLYYNLNVMPLQIPELHEHAEDVSDLLQYYVDYCVRNDNLPYRHFGMAAQNRLRNYGWPGNIRELKNLVQRLLILGGDEEIGLEEVETMLGSKAVPVAINGLSPTVFDLPLREARDQFERVYLEHQLEVSGGSVGKLAKLAGMERTNLYRKLKALGIDPKSVGR